MTEPQFPEHLKYTAEHEWVSVIHGTDGTDGADTVRVGITAFAAEALGDIVYVDLPESGADVQAGEPCGEVESTKSVSDIYAPVSGTVVARNDALDGTPELVNSDPYGDGWMFEVRPADPGQLEGLLDSAAYASRLDAS